jgi:hypothetical protein
MNSAVQQILTIAGVLVGAVASYLAAMFTERTRWRRTESARWDEKRLAAYTEYASAVKIVINLAWRVAATRGLPSTGQPIDINDGLKQLSIAEDERGARWETVLMLGDAETIAAARTWHECAWKLGWFARGKYSNPDQFSATFDESNQARAKFYASARKDLRVAGGDVPVTISLPAWGNPRAQPPEDPATTN